MIPPMGIPLPLRRVAVAALLFAGAAPLFAVVALLLAGAACSSSSPTDTGTSAGDLRPVTDRRRDDASLPGDSARVSLDLSGNAICLKLVARYRDLLKQAKACSLQAGEPQCQKLVDDWVGCGCLTRVEGANDSALKEMAQVAAEWVTRGCQLTCPDPPCRAQPSGACVAGSDGTRCEDQTR